MSLDESENKNLTVQPVTEYLIDRDCTMSAENSASVKFRALLLPPRRSQ